MITEPSFRRDQDGQLCCDATTLSSLAAEYGTPLFVYSASAIRQAFRAADAALSFCPHLIAYAVKANDNLTVLELLRGLGAGADIVSGGELARVLEAGFRGEQIVFSGVGKTDRELTAALHAGVGSIHIESQGELEALGQLAKQQGTKAKIAFRINPDVNPKTHPYIATGLHNTKFGLEIDAAQELVPFVQRSPQLELEGIACHIGSQIQNPDAMREAVDIAGSFARRCKEAGAPIRYLDAGGGWPIDYGEGAGVPDAHQFGAAIQRGMKSAGVTDLFLKVELGRTLVGSAGVLLSQVVFTKHQPSKDFVVVDAAMTELLRPALYQAQHRIEAVASAQSGKDSAPTSVDVVGPVCETGDFLAQELALSGVRRGDLLAVRDVGAYGAVMSSRYNARPRAAEVLVDGDSVTLIRRRETTEDLWQHERAPD